MTKQTPTPGNWRAGWYSKIDNRGHFRDVIARLHDRIIITDDGDCDTREHEEADAQLFAAAKDLLAACGAALKDFKQERKAGRLCCHDDSHQECSACGLIAHLEDAIAKAEPCE